MENRSKLEVQLAETIAEGMDWDTMFTFVVESLLRNYSSLSDAELKREIEDYAGWLLDEEESE